MGKGIVKGLIRKIFGGKELANANAKRAATWEERALRNKRLADDNYAAWEGSNSLRNSENTMNKEALAERDRIASMYQAAAELDDPALRAEALKIIEKYKFDRGF